MYIPNMAKDVFTLKIISSFSEIRVYLGIFYLSDHPVYRGQCRAAGLREASVQGQSRSGRYPPLTSRKDPF